MALSGCATVLAGLFLLTVGALAAEQPGRPDSAGQSAGGSNDNGTDCNPVTQGSPYIPVDSWVYPAVLRLYSLGYVDNVYLGMRPWTRASLSHMLEETAARIEDAEGEPGADEAEGLYEALTHELRYDTQGPCLAHQGNRPASSRSTPWCAASAARRCATAFILARPSSTTTAVPTRAASITTPAPAAMPPPAASCSMRAASFRRRPRPPATPQALAQAL